MKDVFLYLLSFFIMGLVVVVLYGLIYIKIPQENREALMQVVGAVITWGGGVVGYWIGSSLGSANKTEIIKQQAEKS